MILAFPTIPAGVNNFAQYNITEGIPSNTPAGTPITDVSTVSSATPDAVSTNNSVSATATTTILSDVGIAITGVTNPVNAGAVRSMTVTVTNNGPNDATGVSFTFATPTGTTFQSLTNTSGVVPTNIVTPAVGGTGTVTVTLGTVTNGSSSTYSYSENVLATLAPGTNVFTDTMTVSSTTTDSTPANNTATAQATVTQSADLALTIASAVTGTTVPANQVAIGDTITYTYALSNAGPSVAPSTVVTLNIPANTTFVSAAPLSGPGSPQFTKATVGTPVTSVTFSAGATSYGPGASNNATFQLVVQVNQGIASGTVITANASATTTATNAVNGNDTPTKALTAIVNSEMAITLNANKTLFTTPQNVTYTITVTNNGPTNATSVAFSDPMPPLTQFVSLTQTSGPVFTPTNIPAAGGNGTPSGTLATMNAGAVAVFSLVITYPSTITAPSTSTNTVTVTSQSQDLTPGAQFGRSVTSTVALIADLGLAVTANPNPVVAGNFLTYTCTVTNNGPSPALNAAFTFPFPGNVTLNSILIPSGWTQTSVNNVGDPTGTLTATLASMPATPAQGSQVVFVVTFLVNTNATAANPINNTVTVSTTTTEPSPDTNPDSVVLSIPVQPSAKRVRSAMSLSPKAIRAIPISRST